MPEIKTNEASHQPIYRFPFVGLYCPFARRAYHVFPNLGTSIFAIGISDTAGM